jgi:amino acid transporter
MSSAPAPTATDDAAPEPKHLSVLGTAFLGIGAMIGAGIFALLGEAAVVAGAAVWMSFLIAGAVSILLAYNIVKLGIRYPSSGGLIEYLLRGFGNGRLLGIAAWLGYFAAFIIVTSMVAVSFGAYATSLFLGSGAWSGWDNVFTSLLIVAMAFINTTGARFVSRVASVLVVVLLSVFAVFIVVTLKDINLHLLAFSGYPPFSDIVASVALTFFAFLGFGVMTFAVGDLRDPRRELPRAMVLALGITTVTYVLIALGVFGTLTVPEAIAYGETAIAEAARPSLGEAGFTIMSVAALLATAGATNATLFGASNLTASLAEIGQFPPFLGRGSRLGRHAGLLVTAALVLLIANVVDLSAIASVGSACSLLVFMLVGVAGYRVRAETGANGAVVIAGMAATAVVLGFFVVDTLHNAPETFAAIVAIAALAVVLDAVWKRLRSATSIQAPASQPSPSP